MNSPEKSSLAQQMKSIPINFEIVSEEISCHFLLGYSFHRKLLLKDAIRRTDVCRGRFRPEVGDGGSARHEKTLLLFTKYLTTS